MKYICRDALLGLALVICLAQSVKGQCTFVTTQNQYDANGVAQSPTTTAGCLTLCSTATNCLAASTTKPGVVPFQCLFSTSATPSLTANSQFNFNVPQNNPPQCVKNSVVTPSPVTPSPTVGPTLPPTCPSWETYPNSNALGGVALTTASTQQVCRDACRDDPLCLAIDFAPADFISNCWRHYDATNVANFNEGLAAGVTFEKIDRVCATPAPTPAPTPGPTQNPSTDCTGTWVSRANSNINNGRPQVLLTTLASCQQRCLNDPVCINMDWAPNDPVAACWFHLTNTNINLNNRPGITNYNLTTRACPTACAGVWRNYTNSNVDGGTAYRAAATFEQCRDQCRTGTAVTGCLGFDWDPNSGISKCWLVTDISKFSEGTSNGVTHSRLLSRDCVETTTVSDAVTTQQACSTAYTEYPNMNMDGGIADPSADNVDVCKANCINNPRCIAIDFSQSNAVSKCWILERDTGRKSSLGVSHFALDRGDGAGCQTTTVAAAPTTQDILTTGSAVCVERYEAFPNTNSLNGVGNAGGNSVLTCQALCTTNPACVGIDYDSGKGSGSRCWLHLNAANFVNPNSNVAQVTQYRLTRCAADTTTVEATTTAGCQPTFAETLNKNADGGVGYAAISTILDCQEKCISEATCVALDFDANNPNAQCWLHLDITNIAVLKDAPGVRHHQLTRDCDVPTSTPDITTVSSCEPLWRISPDMHGDGATVQPGLATQTACLAACIADDNCYGADIDKNAVPSRRCWLYFSPITVAQLGAISNVDNYILEDRCPGPTTAACTPDFEVRANSNAANGAPEPDVTTVDQCKALCVSRPSCTGFDYDNNIAPSARCWIHTNANLRTVYNSNIPGVDNYVLNERCPGGTSAPPTFATNSSCIPNWSSFPNQNVNDGTPDAMINTLEECQSKCHDNPNCYGLDWSPGNTASKCWYHFNAALVANPNQGANGVTFYRINSRCGVTTSAPTPPFTPAPTPPPGFCAADLLFLVDSSGSIQDHAPKGQDNWLLVKNYIIDVINDLDVGPGLYNVALITFSNFAQIRFELNSFQDKALLTEQISQLPYAAGYTNTPMAFEKALDVFTPQAGDRPGVPDIIVLLTDGEVTLGSKTQMARDVATLKSQGVNILGVGISEWVNINEVKGIVTDQKLYNVSDFAQLPTQAFELENAIRNTANSLCNGGTNRPFTPRPTPRPDGTTRRPECVPSWSMNPNSNADGGIAQTDITQFTACQQRCLDTSNCLAIDWAPLNAFGNRCFIHTNAFNVRNFNQGTASGVTFYVLDRCPGVSTPSPPGPTPAPATPAPSPLQIIDVSADCLAAHNKVRALHENTPSMAYNNGLQNGAENWAQRLAEERSFYHGSTGENLYQVTDFSQDVTHYVEEAIFAWYNEQLDYVYETGDSSNGNAIGHFTQVIWQDSTSVGCGMVSMTRADGSKEWYVVARYSPPGNFAGQYTNKVNRPQANAVFPTRWQDL